MCSRVRSCRIATPEFAKIGAAIVALGRPMLIVQEGGYNLDRLGKYAVALLKTFL